MLFFSVYCESHSNRLQKCCLFVRVCVVDIWGWGLWCLWPVTQHDLRLSPLIETSHGGGKNKPQVNLTDAKGLPYVFRLTQQKE